MKIKIKQKDLLNSISISQKAVSSKTNIEIHELIYFEAKDDKLTLYSTDGQISIVTSCICSVLEEGFMALNANIISNIIRKFPNDEINIKTENNQVEIVCQKSRFNLVAYSYYEKEKLPELKGEHINIENFNLKQAVTQTEFATSIDETRLALTGILMECKDNNINFVAVDGFRVAKKKIKSLYPKNFEDMKAVIPKRCLLEVSRIIEDSSICEIYKFNNDIVFKSESTIIYCRLIDKKYIEYSNLMEDNSKLSVICNRSNLANSLERASLLADNTKANLIKLEIKDGQISIKSNSELGDVFEEVEAKKSGHDLKIAFNARYLLDGVKAINTKYIKLNFQSSYTPCLMYSFNEETKKESDEYIYLALPVRLANE